MVTRRRAERAQRRLAGLTFLLCISTPIGGCSLTESPYESETVKGEEAVGLIDSMRAKGSFEEAGERLKDTRPRHRRTDRRRRPRPNLEVRRRPSRAEDCKTRNIV